MQRMHSAMKRDNSGAEAMKLIQVGQVTNEANVCISFVYVSWPIW